MARPGAMPASLFLAALGPPGLLAGIAKLARLNGLCGHRAGPGASNNLAGAPALAGIQRLLVQLLPSGGKTVRL